MFKVNNKNIFFSVSIADFVSLDTFAEFPLLVCKYVS